MARKFLALVPMHKYDFGRILTILSDSGSYPSGQRGQTVNLLTPVFSGSNPLLPTIFLIKNDGAGTSVEDVSGAFLWIRKEHRLRI